MKLEIHATKIFPFMNRLLSEFVCVSCNLKVLEWVLVNLPMEFLQIINKFIAYPELIQTHLYISNRRVHGGNQLYKAYQHLLSAQKHAIKMDLPIMQANALVEMALYHLRMGSRNYKQAERDFKRA